MLLDVSRLRKHEDPDIATAAKTTRSLWKSQYLALKKFGQYATLGQVSGLKSQPRTATVAPPGSTVEDLVEEVKPYTGLQLQDVDSPRVMFSPREQKPYANQDLDPLLQSPPTQPDLSYMVPDNQNSPSPIKHVVVASRLVHEPAYQQPTQVSADPTGQSLSIEVMVCTFRI